MNIQEIKEIVDALEKEFDSHAFIRKYMEKFPQSYGELLMKHGNVTTAHAEISNCLRNNTTSLGIKKNGSVRSLDVFLKMTSNALWSKVKKTH
jgi:hypothetical protein